MNPYFEIIKEIYLEFSKQDIIPTAGQVWEKLYKAYTVRDYLGGKSLPSNFFASYFDLKTEMKDFNPSAFDFGAEAKTKGSIPLVKLINNRLLVTPENKRNEFLQMLYVFETCNPGYIDKVPLENSPQPYDLPLDTSDIQDYIDRLMSSVEEEKNLDDSDDEYSNNDFFDQRNQALLAVDILILKIPKMTESQKESIFITLLNYRSAISIDIDNINIDDPLLSLAKALTPKSREKIIQLSLNRINIIVNDDEFKKHQVSLTETIKKEYKSAYYVLEHLTLGVEIDSEIKRLVIDTLLKNFKGNEFAFTYILIALANDESTPDEIKLPIFNRLKEVANKPGGFGNFGATAKTVIAILKFMPDTIKDEIMAELLAKESKGIANDKYSNYSRDLSSDIVKNVMTAINALLLQLMRDKKTKDLSASTKNKLIQELTGIANYVPNQVYISLEYPLLFLLQSLIEVKINIPPELIDSIFIMLSVSHVRPLSDEWRAVILHNVVGELVAKSSNDTTREIALRFLLKLRYEEKHLGDPGPIDEAIVMIARSSSDFMQKQLIDKLFIGDFQDLGKRVEFSETERVHMLVLLLQAVPAQKAYVVEKRGNIVNSLLAQLNPSEFIFNLEDLKKILKDMSHDADSQFLIVYNAQNKLTNLIRNNALTEYYIQLLMTYDDSNRNMATAVFKALDKTTTCIPYALINICLRNIDHSFTQSTRPEHDLLHPRIFYCDCLTRSSSSVIPSESQENLFKFLRNQCNYVSKNTAGDNVLKKYVHESKSENGNHDLIKSVLNVLANFSEIIPNDLRAWALEAIQQIILSVYTGYQIQDYADKLKKIIKDAPIENRSIYIYGVLTQCIDDALKKNDLRAYQILEKVRVELCNHSKEEYLADKLADKELTGLIAGVLPTEPENSLASIVVSYLKK